MYPTLLHLGHLSLPTFGALAAFGLMFALILSEHTAQLVQVDPAKLWNAGIFAVVSAFVLSRVLLAIAYWKSFRAFPILLLTVPSLTPIALLLTVFATSAWLWFHRVPLLGALNAWAPCGMVVWMCLALGHFAEGSDPGMPTRLPWGVAPMPGEALRVHPVALYAAVLALALALSAYSLLKRGIRTTAGWTLIAAGVGQFLLSFLRQPGAVGPGGLETLQWVAVGMIGAGCALVLTEWATIEQATAP